MKRPPSFAGALADGDDLAGREDWDAMVDGAHAFNREVKRISGAYPGMSLDRVKDSVWGRLGAPGHRQLGHNGKRHKT